MKTSSVRSHRSTIVCRALCVYWRVLCNIADKMPAARGVKRSASKSSATTASTGPKNKKKRGGEYQCDVIGIVFFTFLSNVNDLSNHDGGKCSALLLKYNWRLFRFVLVKPYNIIWVNAFFLANNEANCFYD